MNYKIASDVKFDDFARNVITLRVSKQLGDIQAVGGEPGDKPVRVIYLLVNIFGSRPVKSAFVESVKPFFVAPDMILAKCLDGEPIDVLAIDGGVFLVDNSAGVGELIVVDQEAVFRGRTPQGLIEVLRELVESALEADDLDDASRFVAAIAGAQSLLDRS